MKITIDKAIFHFLKKLNLLNYLNDKQFLTLQFHAVMGEKLDLRHPVSFNQKLQWLKINDKNPNYTKLVDKSLAKKIASNIIGEKYIIPTIAEYEKAEDIDFSKLPNSFVLKTTHDSGGVIIINNKNEIDRSEIIKKLNKSLSKNFYWEFREWPYKNVKRKIIAERLMGTQEEIVDYKFMCFEGKVKYVFTCTERNKEKGTLYVTFFDPEWNKQSFERHYPSSPTPIKKPNNLEKMIKIAEKLSENLFFVRVDLYDVNDNIYFGEWTFYPGAGLEEFHPYNWDMILGGLINLDSLKKHNHEFKNNLKCL